MCEFIAENRDRFGVAPICRVLTEHGVPIAPRTFHALVRRAPEAGLVGCHDHEIQAGYYEADEHGRKSRSRYTVR